MDVVGEDVLRQNLALLCVVRIVQLLVPEKTKVQYRYAHRLWFDASSGSCMPLPCRLGFDVGAPGKNDWGEYTTPRQQRHTLLEEGEVKGLRVCEVEAERAEAISFATHPCLVVHSLGCCTEMSRSPASRPLLGPSNRR